jgi:hypothetical protein
MTQGDRRSALQFPGVGAFARYFRAAFGKAIGEICAFINAAQSTPRRRDHPTRNGDDCDRM